MKIIRQFERVTGVAFERVFQFKTDSSGGFSFTCNEFGEIEPLTNDQAKANLAGCLSGSVDGHEVVDLGVRRRQWAANVPAIGECLDCEREVILHGADNQCECGAIYNCFGQRLAPREFWGEDDNE